MCLGFITVAESNDLDPRLKPLVGTWEGRVRWQNSRAEEGRVLLIVEKAGQLQAQYGVTGQKLFPVNLSIDTSGSRLKLSFTTGAGNPVALMLEKDDYLIGTVHPLGHRSKRRLQRAADRSPEEEVIAKRVLIVDSACFRSASPRSTTDTRTRS
jgi:hypothetical protein